jgi:hypothetical protein
MARPLGFYAVPSSNAGRSVRVSSSACLKTYAPYWEICTKEAGSGAALCRCRSVPEKGILVLERLKAAHLEQWYWLLIAEWCRI